MYPSGGRRKAAAFSSIRMKGAAPCIPCALWFAGLMCACLPTRQLTHFAARSSTKAKTNCYGSWARRPRLYQAFCPRYPLPPPPFGEASMPVVSPTKRTSWMWSSAKPFIMTYGTNYLSVCQNIFNNVHGFRQYPACGKKSRQQPMRLIHRGDIQFTQQEAYILIVHLAVSG